MALRGLTLPNAQWRLYTAEEEAAVLDLRPQALLILGYPDSPILEAKTEQEARLWEALGRPPVLLRPYAENIMRDYTPQEWHRKTKSLLEAYLVRMPVEWVPWNEPNIEGMGEDWDRQIRFAIGYVWPFRQDFWDVPLHLPALSPRGNYHDGLLSYSSATLPGPFTFNKVDIHCYTEAQLEDAQFAWNHFRAPVCITEINQMAPSFYLRRLTGMSFVEAAYWFILKWIDPEPGAPNVDLLGSPYYEDFRQMTHQDDPSGGVDGTGQPNGLPAQDQPLVQPGGILEEEVPMNIQEATLRDMWKRQGVEPPANGTNAFWDYALAVVRTQGRVIIPQPSKDGNFENHDDPTFVIAYTFPAMYTVKGGAWTVSEGLPPL